MIASFCATPLRTKFRFPELFKTRIAKEFSNVVRSLDDVIEVKVSRHMDEPCFRKY
jgi:hypothetical protein